MMEYPSTGPLRNTATSFQRIGNTTTSREGRYTKEIEILLKSLYSIVGLAAIVLNTIICLLYVRRKVRRTSFNFLLLMLSLSDIASAIFITPYIFIDVSSLNLSPHYRNYLCALANGMMPFWISTFVSIFMLCLISVNRYFLINHPRRALWLRKKQFAWGFFFLFWLSALMIWSPTLITYRYDLKYGVCRRDWPPGFRVGLYTFATTGLGVVVPISFMLGTFISTARTLWGANVVAGNDSAILKGRKRVVSLLGILILAYFICSLPSAVYFILARATRVFPSGVEGEYLRMKVSRVAVLFALCNTVMDPLIYALRSQEFRAAFRGFFSNDDRQRLIVTFSDTNFSSVALRRLSVRK